MLSYWNNIETRVNFSTDTRIAKLDTRLKYVCLTAFFG